MGTARDRAIEMLIELVDPSCPPGSETRARCTRYVDAQIEAAREPESAYTRELDQRQKQTFDKTHRDPRV